MLWVYLGQICQYSYRYAVTISERPIWSSFRIEVFTDSLEDIFCLVVLFLSLIESMFWSGHKFS